MIFLKNQPQISLIEFKINEGLIIYSLNEVILSSLAIDQNRFQSDISNNGYYLFPIDHITESLLDNQLKQIDITTNDISFKIIVIEESDHLKGIIYINDLVTPYLFNQLINRLLNRSGSIFWFYDISQDLLYRGVYNIQKYGMEEHPTASPLVFTKNGTVHPNSHDDFIGLFEKIKNGEDCSKAILSKGIYGQFTWVLLSFFVVKDLDNNPVCAIGFGGNLEEKIIESVKHESTQGSYGLNLEINLSQNTYLYHQSTINVNENNIYEEITNLIADYYQLEDRNKNQLLEFLEKQPVEFLNSTGAKLLGQSKQDSHLLFYSNAQNEVSCSELIANTYYQNDDLKLLITINSGNNLGKKNDTDYLTGLTVFNLFEKNVSQSLMLGLSGYLIVIDIDNFRQINDTFGYGYGDDFLHRLAIAFEKTLGPKDIITRLGGDEFAIWLPKANHDYVEKIVNRLFKQVKTIKVNDGQKIKPTISMGITKTKSGEITFNELFEQADIALKNAKQKGKNQPAYFVRKNTDLSTTLSSETILDMLDDIIYVCSLETFELLYLNQKGRELPHLANMNVNFLKCYEAISRLDHRCPYCEKFPFNRHNFVDYYVGEEDIPTAGNRKFRLRGKEIIWNGQRARLVMIHLLDEQELVNLNLQDKLQRHVTTQLFEKTPFAIAQWRIDQPQIICNPQFKQFLASKLTFNQIANIDILREVIAPSDFGSIVRGASKLLGRKENFLSEYIHLKLIDHQEVACRIDFVCLRENDETIGYDLLVYRCSEEEIAEGLNQSKHDDYDQLTGALKYERLINILQHRTYLEEYVYYLSIIDINNFSSINETNGYLEGDEIIRKLSIHLSSHIGISFDRDDTLIAHIEGDRFVVFSRIASNVENVENTISNIVNEVVTSFDEIMKYQRNLIITKTVGGIVIFKEDPKDIRQLIDDANSARKQIKNDQGRNVAVYDSGLRRILNHELALEKASYNAFQNEEFIVYYQPKVDPQTNLIVSAEALVRWDSKEFGFLYPDGFIPLFEKRGIIEELDYYMIRKACLKIVSLIKQGVKPCPISVNQSRIHFNNPNYVKDICAIVDSYNIDHRLIELEITESILINNSSEVIDKINQLHRHNFLVSLDDFGVGFSSLGNINDLNLDTIKIDGSLIRNLDNNPRSQIIVKHLIDMFRQMKIVVVAEWVDDLKQVELLRKWQCDLIQGYYYYKPLPEEIFTKIYLDQNKKVIK